MKIRFNHVSGLQMVSRSSLHNINYPINITLFQDAVDVKGSWT